MKKITRNFLISSILIASNTSFALEEANPNFITHNFNSKLNISEHEARLKTQESPCLEVEDELKMLSELQQFELGRFLLQNRGLNGYWTSYIVAKGPKMDLAHPLENWIVNNAPVIKATQERHKIFQRQLHKYLKINSKIASVPCGTMEDLLSLNLDGIYDIKMIGIDLDEESIELAKANYQPNKNNSIELIKKDDWNLEIEDDLDLVVSNGLNIYEPDDNKVTELYKQFYDSLKEGGVLITSFLTPPPDINKRSTWHDYDKEDALKQRALFSDILQIKWQTFRTEDDTRKHLEDAGFEVVEVIYDSQGMFPTVVAKK